MRLHKHRMEQTEQLLRGSSTERRLLWKSQERALPLYPDSRSEQCHLQGLPSVLFFPQETIGP